MLANCKLGVNLFPMSAAKPSCPVGARSPCPIANALDLLGDRWSLLVIRDLLFTGKRRFGDFLGSAEGIPTNILTDRLRRLEEAGVVTKVQYLSRPPRYEYHLTSKGGDLFPVLREMALWANRHVPGTFRPPPGFMERAEEAARRTREAETGGEGPVYPHLEG